MDCGKEFKKDAPINKKRCHICAAIHTREQRKSSKRVYKPTVRRKSSKRTVRSKQVQEAAIPQSERESSKRVYKPTVRPKQVQEAAIPQSEPLLASVVPSKKEKKRLQKMSKKERHEEDERYMRPMVTRFCPESIPVNRMYDVKMNPEYYIEINIVKHNRVVEAFYIDSEVKGFNFKNKKYKIEEDNVYLLPTRGNVMMPTSYYREGDTSPKGFRQQNKGITGKALSLLYMEQLYTSLLYSEDVKYNFFIVILSIAILICFGIGIYLLFYGGWQTLPSSSNPIPVIPAMIRGWF